MDMNLITSEVSKVEDITNEGRDIYNKTSKILDTGIHTLEDIINLVKYREELYFLGQDISYETISLGRIRTAISISKKVTTNMEDFYI